MIEDLIAQNHLLVDTLTYDQGRIAHSALRTLAENRDTGGPYAHLAGIDVRAAGEGRCRGVLTVRHHHLNPLNIAHGGVTYTLGDHVCGVAAWTTLDRPVLVTQDVHIRYHAPARPGELVAEASVLHKGSRTISVTGTIAQDGVLVASLSATYAILTPDELAARRDRA